jgi:hypothetical protein
MSPCYGSVRPEVELLSLEHQLNGLSGGAIVLNRQNAHADGFL